MEYVLALRERHNYANGKNPSVRVGNIAQIKGEQKNREKWKNCLIAKTIIVNDI